MTLEAFKLNPYSDNLSVYPASGHKQTQTKKQRWKWDWDGAHSVKWKQQMFNKVAKLFVHFESVLTKAL